jgi:hypothetical protein
MLLEDLSDYLSSGGIATPIYKGLAPESPEAVVVLYETGGLAPTHSMNAAAGQAVVENPRVQVVCRAGQYDYSAARTSADAVFKLLDGLPRRSINGVEYLWGAAVQSPFLMGRDESGRVLVACNYQIVKRLS